MFANRFTAFMDACSLVGVLKRNVLLTLAEADFFRVRWSAQVLTEVQWGIEGYLNGKGAADAAGRAAHARDKMELAFEDAMVVDFDELLPLCHGLPDPNDAHVLAAALKTRASTIVTENLRHFPSDKLSALNIEARSTDMFIADTIDLDQGRAVAAIRKMRSRLNKPEMTSEQLLLLMDSHGMTQTVDVLKSHVLSL